MVWDAPPCLHCPAPHISQPNHSTTPPNFFTYTFRELVFLISIRWVHLPRYGIGETKAMCVWGWKIILLKYLSKRSNITSWIFVQQPYDWWISSHMTVLMSFDTESDTPQPTHPIHVYLRWRVRPKLPARSWLTKSGSCNVPPYVLGHPPCWDK